jgi:hypothetical protein
MTQKARVSGPFRDGACRDRTGDLRLAKPALSQTELTPRTCMVEPNREYCALPILMRLLRVVFYIPSDLAQSHEDREENPPVTEPTLRRLSTSSRTATGETPVRDFEVQRRRLRTFMRETGAYALPVKRSGTRRRKRT